MCLSKDENNHHTAASALICLLQHYSQLLKEKSNKMSINDEVLGKHSLYIQKKKAKKPFKQTENLSFASTQTDLKGNTL